MSVSPDVNNHENIHEPVMDVVQRARKTIQLIAQNTHDRVPTHQQTQHHWTEEWLMHTPNDNSSETVVVPVEHVLKLKYLEEDEEGNIFAIGVMVQQIIGIVPRDKDGNTMYFGYRIDGLVASEDQYQFRRAKVSDREGYPCVSITGSVRIPLQTDVVFNRYPFVAVKASAKLELSTFAVRNIEFRADFALGSQDLVDQNVYRNFCCLKDAHSESFNRMSSFSLITPYPSVSMECEWKDKQVHYMKAFEVSFWLFEPFERKFIQILLPIIIILILGIINVFAIQSAPEFISNTSSVALTLVFLLPSMSPQGGAKETKFSTNDRAVALIFIALVVNCCKFFFFTSVSGVEEQNNISESVASGISLVLIRDIILPATCAALFASSLIYPIKNYNEFTALKKSIAKTNYFGKPFNVSTNQDVVVSSKTKIDFLRVQTHQPPKKKDPKNMKGQDLSSRRCYKASLHFGFRE